MLTESELEAIEKRLEAATPGPWMEVGESGEFWLLSDFEGPKECVVIADTGKAMLPNNPCDIDLIANAPTDIAALLADLQLYKKAVEEAVDLGYIELTPENGIECNKFGQKVWESSSKFPALATILKGVKG